MDQAEYFQSHPPRCIRDFEVQNADLSGHVFDGHGEKLNSYFNLFCKCGSDHFQITLLSNPLMDPISLTCVACSRQRALLDTKIHGYDGELGSNDASNKGERIMFACPTCGDCTHGIYVRFEYPGDLLDPESGLDEFRGREQDLFSWFTLVGDCTACRVLKTICEIECA